MYGPLLLVIICLPILIATIAFGKIAYSKYKNMTINAISTILAHSIKKRNTSTMQIGS